MPAYNSSDPTQQSFLKALSSGEGGGNYSVGYGGVDLSHVPVDQYGFPQWSGAITASGPTHAAGAYQFQPGTWRAVAAKFGLNFQNPKDQDAGAWQLAQQQYASATGGDLETDLQAGKFGQIQQALSSTWTSLKTGDFGQKVAAEASPGATGSTWPSWSQWISDPTGSAAHVASSYFIRGSMILVGVVVLIVALWALLSHYNAVPEAVRIGN